MAVYTIKRKGNLTPLELKTMMKAFGTLYCNKYYGHKDAKALICGKWFTDTNRPITVVDGRIIYFGVCGMTVTIEYKNEQMEKERIVVELTPKGDVGFSEITFLSQ